MFDRCGRLWFSAWLCSCVFAGCGSGDGVGLHQLSNATVVKAGDPFVEHSALPQPVMQITDPKAGASFSVGPARNADDLVHCLVRLEVPKGGKTPEALSLQLLSDGSLAGSSELLIKEKLSDSVWILEGDLQPPARKGRYKLRAEGIQTVIVEPGKSGSAPSHKITRPRSPELEIRIGE